MLPPKMLPMGRAPESPMEFIINSDGYVLSSMYIYILTLISYSSPVLIWRNGVRCATLALIRLF